MRWLLTLALGAATLTGCDRISSEEQTQVCDRDGDGHLRNDNYCNQLDSNVEPDCNDEDGSIQGPVTWYGDGDGDGFGGDIEETDCPDNMPDNFVDNNDDCNDSELSVNPDASEIACDGIDNDCDGTDNADGEIFYQDADNDGFGNANNSTNACEQPDGYVTDSSDCDDTDNTINPAAAEGCNDGVDQNCNGDDDEGTGSNWRYDQDGDGFGDAFAEIEVACEQPSENHVTDREVNDCDDTNVDVNPDADEICDTIDNDCDEQIDDDDTDLDLSTTDVFFRDADGDNYGNASIDTQACEQPDGYVSDNQDCDDTTVDVNPDADELCSDDIDNNCDGDVNENTAIDADTWYADSDSDTFGDPTNTTTACEQPSGYLADNQDCDDTNGDINPDATEVCDEVDNDCNGDIDDNDSGLDLSGADEWYPDEDEDGFGDDAASSTLACEDPSDSGGCSDGDTATTCYVFEDSTDCDDTEADVNPDAHEAHYDLSSDTVTDNCSDGLDNNCNGDSDSSDDACIDSDSDGLEDGKQLLFAYDIDSDGDDEGLYFAQAFADAGSAWASSTASYYCVTTNTYPWDTLSLSAAETEVTSGVTWGGHTYTAQVCLLPRTSGYAIQQTFSYLGTDGSSTVDPNDSGDFVDVGLQTYCSNTDAGGSSDYCAEHSTYGWYAESTYDSSSGAISPGPS